MKTIILDTNIVYYLCDVSKNDFFDNEKFTNYCLECNCKKGLTIFTVLEILNRYRNIKSRASKIFEFLDKEIQYIVCEIPQKNNYYRMFKKCKKSNKKYEVYRIKLIKEVIEYHTDFIVDLSFILGYFYLVILKETENKQKKQYSSDNHLRNLLSLIREKYENDIYKIVREEYVSFLEKYYTSCDPKMNKSICLERFNLVMNEMFKFFNLMYRVVYQHECSNEEEVEDVKKQIRNDSTLSMESFLTMFSKYKKSTKYIKKFDEIYNRVCKKSSTTRSLALKYITSKMLCGEKYDYNDITDALNIASSEYISDKTVYYMTAEKSWLDFFERNSSENEYCSKNYNFIMCFINYRKID